MGIVSGIGKRAAKISKEVKVRRRELAREKYKKTFNKLTDRQKKKVQDQAEIEVWGLDPGEQEAKMMDRAKAADKKVPKTTKQKVQEEAVEEGAYKERIMREEGLNVWPANRDPFPKPKGAKGMLIGPAYRHGYKDLRKTGTAKRMK